MAATSRYLVEILAFCALLRIIAQISFVYNKRAKAYNKHIQSIQFPLRKVPSIILKLTSALVVLFIYTGINGRTRMRSSVCQKQGLFCFCAVFYRATS
jgi:hypothetical protein